MTHGRRRDRPENAFTKPPLLRAVSAADDAAFEDSTVAVSSNLEPITAVLVDSLCDSGAEVLCTTARTDNADEDVVAYLDRLSDVTVYADRRMTDVERDEAHRALLQREPDVLLTAGAELLVKLHRIQRYPTYDTAGCVERTAGGVSRARELEDDDSLDVPVYTTTPLTADGWFDDAFRTGGQTSSEHVYDVTDDITGEADGATGCATPDRGTTISSTAFTLLESDLLRDLRSVAAVDYVLSTTYAAARELLETGGDEAVVRRPPRRLHREILEAKQDALDDAYTDVTEFDSLRTPGFERWR